MAYPLLNTMPRVTYGINGVFPGSSGQVAPHSLSFSQVTGSNAGKPYEIDLSPQTAIATGKPVIFNLSLYNPVSGLPPSQLNILHEKQAHLFLVNQDLSDFQHIHPTVITPGLLQFSAQFKQPGTYKLFIQFATPAEGEQTLNKPFTVGTSTSHVPKAKPLQADNYLLKQSGGYLFKLSGLPTQRQPMGMIRVDVMKPDGQPVKDIQPFLGAAAHGVIISQNLQSFIHTHPMDKPINGLYQSPVNFHTHIAQPGYYKFWTQTCINGTLHTVNWVFQV
jgi:hypothetical protein